MRHPEGKVSGFIQQKPNHPGEMLKLLKNRPNYLQLQAKDQRQNLVKTTLTCYNYLQYPPWE